MQAAPVRGPLYGTGSSRLIEPGQASYMQAGSPTDRKIAGSTKLPERGQNCYWAKPVFSKPARRGAAPGLNSLFDPARLPNTCQARTPQGMLNSTQENQKLFYYKKLLKWNEQWTYYFIIEVMNKKIVEREHPLGPNPTGVWWGGGGWITSLRLTTSKTSFYPKSGQKAIFLQNIKI